MKRMKKEDVDKIVEAIKDSVPVYKDVKAAMEDGKITWVEGGSLIIEHGGKAVRLVMAAKEIGCEIADLEPEEAEEVIKAIVEAYGGDESTMEGVKHIAKGLAELRTGLEILIAK